MDFKKYGKPAVAIALCAAMTTPQIVSAVRLSEVNFNNPYNKASWGLSGDIVENLTPTGLSSNWISYNKATPDWPFDAAMFLSTRHPDERFAKFNNRYIYCVANHTANYILGPGSQAFLGGIWGQSQARSGQFEPAQKGIDPDFNFLVLAIASAYPNKEIDPDEQSSIAYSLVCQSIAWATTYDGGAGKAYFGGGHENHPGDGGKSEADFQTDLAAWHRTNHYQAMMNDISFTKDSSPEIYSVLHSAPPSGSAAAQHGMTNFADMVFYDVWHAANLTQQFDQNWQAGISTTLATKEEKDGEYHAYLNLFSSDAARSYADGMKFTPYGDWEFVQMDPATGICDFKSTTGETDANGAIGSISWEATNTASGMPPMDLTKAQIYSWKFYTTRADHSGKFSINNGQTYFCSRYDDNIELYVTFGTPDNPDTPSEGNDSIDTNYAGEMGVNDSDINKYNWGNDEGTQFERWDDPHEDPCDRDENVIGEDGLLYEINSDGSQSEDVAHTDVKKYSYMRLNPDLDSLRTSWYSLCTL